MSEQNMPDSQSVPPTEVSLRILAEALRQADHLEPDTQKALASLLDELGTEFSSSRLTTPGTAQLADALGAVARSLHEQQSQRAVATARDRLKEAAAKVEVEAPVASGVVYRLVDLLSNIGI